MDKQTISLVFSDVGQINRAKRNWYLGVRVSQLHQLTGLSLFCRGRTWEKDETWEDNVKEKMATSNRGCSTASFKPWDY